MQAAFDQNVSTGEGGLQAVMELLHLFLESPRWEESAMERAKQMYLSHYRSLGKGLERATADRVMSCMLGPDRCTPDTSGTHPFAKIFPRSHANYTPMSMNDKCQVSMSENASKS